MLSDKDVWHIHGNRYDLTPFLKEHPGGSSILFATKGLQDCTPIFESYHAFANREYIRNKLETYREFGPGNKPLYSYDGFYSTLISRAREHFGATSDSISVTKKVKANTWWWVKISIEFVIFATFWLFSFVIPSSIESKFLLGFLTGVIFISFGFNTMHDASHFAIKERNHWINSVLLRGWTAWALWSGAFWMTHHVVRHHGFTGHPELDPDTQHARPFVRKSLESSRKKYVRVPIWLKQVWQYALLAVSVFAFLPGMFVGQILSYSIIWPIRKHLWKMPKPQKGAFDRTWVETLLSLTSFLCLFFGISKLASVGFFIGCNIAYAICILPDHDSFESAIENHLDCNEVQDWGEIQVRHSSDFGKGVWGQLFGDFAGGINFQIVHHLFPGVSHVHFSELTKVVEKVCEEYKVPFVRHDSLAAALWSVAKTFTATMSIAKDIEEEDLLQIKATTPPSSPMTLKNAYKRNRKYDLITGLLFGAWLALCSAAVYRVGQHLLIVPASLIICMGIYWAAGLFRKPNIESKKHGQVARLNRPSIILFLFLSIFSLDNLRILQSSSDSTLLFKISSESVILMGIGLIAAEMFGLVMSKIFKRAYLRLLLNTIELTLFTIFILRGEGGVEKYLKTEQILSLIVLHTLTFSNRLFFISIVLHVALLGFVFVSPLVL